MIFSPDFLIGILPIRWGEQMNIHPSIQYWNEVFFFISGFIWRYTSRDVARNLILGIGKKIIDLLRSQINKTSLGRCFSLPFLPATPYYSSWTLEGPFWADMAPFNGPRLPELQRNKDIERCAELGTEVCLKRTFSFFVIWRAQAPLGSPLRPSWWFSQILSKFIVK